MKPFWSLSNTLKASFNSSSASVSCKYHAEHGHKLTVEYPRAFLAEDVQDNYLRLPCHKVEEFPKFDGAVSIDIDFSDHVLQLFVGWVLAQRTDDGAELFERDAACESNNQVKAGTLNWENSYTSGNFRASG